MILSIIKFTFIILCNCIIFRKSLNIKDSRYLLCFIMSLGLSVISILINQIYAGLDLCVMFIFCPFLFKLLYKQTYSTTLLATISSIAISLILYCISLTLTIPFALTVGTAMSYSYEFNIISRFVTGIISIILANSLFKIKHLKHGFSFIQKKDYTEVSIILSCGIIFIYTFYRFGQIQSLHLYIIIVAFALIFGLAFYLTNEKQYVVQYNMHIKNIKIASLENELNIQQNELIHYKNANNKLDSIVHRDNKLIPAMEATVKDVLISYNPTKATKLLEQLSCLTSERKGILTNYEYANTAISHTENIRINSIINYMHMYALEKKVNFNFVYFGDITTMIPKIVSEEDLCTLVADIVENAIIATQSKEKKCVFLSIEASDNKYAFSVYDSGDFFSKEVIKRIGKRRYTTHKNIGGTGIGLMTTFELLSKYSASFIIDEHINNLPYTKYVSIIFDNLNKRTYNTYK